MDQTISEPSVLISVNATSTEEIQHVELTIKNSGSQVLSVSELSSPYEKVWNLLNVPNDAYNLKVVVTDTDGDTASAEVSIVINNADTDGDGWSNDEENSCFSDPFNSEIVPNDFDNDGVCDYMDTDSDDDGWSNADEESCGTSSYNAADFPIDTNDDGICDNPVFHWLKLSEHSVFNDDLFGHEFTLTAKVAGDISCIRVGLSGKALPGDNSSCEDTDDVLHEKTLSVTFTLGINPYASFRSFMEHLVGGIEFLDADGEKVPYQSLRYNSNTVFAIGVVDSSDTVGAIQQTANIWTTDTIANIVVPSDYTGSLDELAQVTKSFCDLFQGNVFDFLVIENYYSSQADLIPGAAAYALKVGQNPKGLGATFSDNTAFYGCPAGLKSIAYMTVGKKTGYDVPHELSHHYGVHFNNEDLILTYDALNGGTSWSRVHWGHSTLCGGLMATGQCLRDNGDGTFSIETDPSSINFGQMNNLELYLWGLITRDEVEPQWFVTEPGTYVDWGIELVANQDAHEVTIDDIEAVYGERVTALGPTDYRIGCIVISDRKLSDAEFALETLKCKHYGSNSPEVPFFTSGGMEWVTHGLANFETTLPQIP